MARIVPLKKWREFLKSRGLILIRTKGGHEVWDYPDDRLVRPVIFSAHHKEITSKEISSNLRTMGLKMEDLDVWLID
jgi:hypothetical protein